MFNLVEKRRWYFILSALIIIPGLAIMGYSWATTGAPFRLSIDFTGGSIYTITFVGEGVTEDGVRTVFEQNGDENPVIQRLGSENETRWVLSNPTSESTDSDVVTGEILDDFAAAGLDGSLAVGYTDGIGYVLNFSSDAITEENVRSAFASLTGEGATLTETPITTYSIRAGFKETEAERQALEADLEATRSD